MNFQAQIEEMPFHQALMVRAECKMMQMGKVMSQSMLKIASHLEAQGQPTKQAPFARYYDFKFDEVVNQGVLKMLLGMFTHVWKFEVGFPVENKVEAAGDLQPVEYNYGKVATCIHQGPYKKVGATYKQLHQWLKENGHTPQDTSFEIYLNDPCKTPEAELKTKIVIPLK